VYESLESCLPSAVALQSLGAAPVMNDLARHLDIVLVDPGGFCHVDGMKVVAMEDLVSFVSFGLCAL
jgi:hypothetical protein